MQEIHSATTPTEQASAPSWPDIFRRGGVAYGSDGDALGSLALARSQADPSALHTAAVLLAAMDDPKSRPLAGAMLSRLFLACPKAADVLAPGAASIAAFAWASSEFYKAFETWELPVEALGDRTKNDGEAIIAESLERFQNFAESAADFAADPLAALSRRSLLIPASKTAANPPTSDSPTHPLAPLFDANYSTGAPHTYHIGALNAAFAAGFRLPEHWPLRAQFVEQAPLLCALRHNAKALRTVCAAAKPPSESLGVFLADTLNRALDALDATEQSSGATPGDRLLPRNDREAAERLRSNRKASARLAAVHLASCAEWSRSVSGMGATNPFLTRLMGSDWLDELEQADQTPPRHLRARAFARAASDAARFASFCASVALAAKDQNPRAELPASHPAWSAWSSLLTRLGAGPSRAFQRAEPSLAADFCRLSTALPGHSLAPTCLDLFSAETRSRIERKLLAGISTIPSDEDDQPARKLRL